MRTAYYVASTHWDREWYEPLQGFRMRLVSLLDEVFATLERDPSFRSFVMDGQTIPAFDYLEVRPERTADLRRYAASGRFRLGPWYVLPDEWLVSGESLVRNLQIGMALARELGAEPSRSGIVCDQFGHIGQLPQIFAQFGFPAALLWRGTHERDHAGLSLWQAPDGTALPTYRFGYDGYCNYAFSVREAWELDKPFDLEAAAERLVAFTLAEARRTPGGPILIFDGGDHLEIEPRTSELLAAANAELEAHGIQLRHADLDAYGAALGDAQEQIAGRLVGELRATGRESLREDKQWLIPGVLSSRMHLKQRNAACEDELCQWAEPFSAFASARLPHLPYPDGFLRVAWRHLLENHPHDSICGCSIDQVHQDMIYRFDQSLGIASRLSQQAMKAIALAAAPLRRPDGALVLAVFNHTAADLDEPLDIDIPLPADWPARFQEFFGFEEKFGFRLVGPDGAEVPYQLVAQRRDFRQFRRPRYKFPDVDTRHIVSVTARLRVPSFGYTTLTVVPAAGPTRFLGTMAPSHRAIENELLRVQVNANGTLTLLDKRTGASFDQLLTFEQRADIGDGWFHGVAVNDQVYTSAAAGADVALVADGVGKATLRIGVTLHVPEEFDFHTMTRSGRTTPLRVVSDVTLREGADHIEVTTTVDNTARDHRLRVLFPTGLRGQTYLSDSAFDAVERPVALADDNATRRELEVETRPQITWTAFGDGERGLAVVTRGLPESAVVDTADRPIALTLLRAFRRAVLTNDNPGGQMQGSHTFRYAIVPFVGAAPIDRLFLLGQRAAGAARAVDLLPAELAQASGALPPAHAFLRVRGPAVVSSVQRHGDGLLMRLFNPHAEAAHVRVSSDHAGGVPRAVTLDGEPDSALSLGTSDGDTLLVIPPKRIVTVLL